MTQASFGAALRQPATPAPDGLRARPGCQVDRRFDVYRNNHVASLAQGLEEGFPVCRALVGEDFFREMARCFALSCPPRSPILAEYGRALPAFIETFAPAASVPYLPDMARLEQLRIDAWHGADAAPLGRDGFDVALHRPDLLLSARVRMHPTAALLRTRYAIAALWHAHQGVGNIESVDPFVPQNVLVVRPWLDVVVLPLPPAAARLVEGLAGGATLGSAVESAIAEQPDADLVVTLAELVASDVVVEIEVPDETCR
jgi:hypothetical protein